MAVSRMQSRRRQRTRRKAQRQQSRSRRVAKRQAARTRRAAGRQAIRSQRIEAKKQSGFYSPEGVAARRAGAAQLVSTAASAATPLIGAGLAALGGGEGNETQPMGESFLQSFGGPVGLGGDPGFTGIDPAMDAPPAKPKMNPAIIAGGVLAAGALIYFATRKK